MSRGKIAGAVIIALFVLSLISPVLTPYGPDDIDLDSIKNSPSVSHPFGTDQMGRDIFTRVLYGGRISLSVAFAAALISVCIGFLVGLVSGYAGGRVDTAIMAFVDLVLSFPSLLLAIGVSVILPPGIYTVMIAIASVGWASFARLIRGHVLTLREAPFMDAARAIGAGRSRMLFVHLMPQCVGLAAVMAGLKLGGYILTEASLGFLGLGAQPPTASWGSMISAGRSYIVSAPWMVVFPGLAIALTALAFNIVGDELSDRYSIGKGL